MQTMTTRTSSRRPSGWAAQQSVPFYKFATRVLTPAIRLWSGGVYGYGMSHVPRGRGVFLIANHTSAIDPFAVSIALEDVILHGPGKKELFKNPVASFLLRKVGIFPLERDGLDPTSVRAMVELYRSGTIVEVYPEGGRSPSGDLMPFDRGFTRLVLKLKAPLVPVGIAGANEMLPMHTLIPRRHAPITVVFGPEFDLSPFYGPRPSEETIEQATLILEQQVRAMVARAREHRAEILSS